MIHYIHILNIELYLHQKNFTQYTWSVVRRMFKVSHKKTNLMQFVILLILILSYID